MHVMVTATTAPMRTSNRRKEKNAHHIAILCLRDLCGFFGRNSLFAGPIRWSVKLQQRDSLRRHCFTNLIRAFSVILQKKHIRISNIM